MPWVIFLVLLFASLLTTPSRAVQQKISGFYNTTAPTASDIPHWNTGWGASNVTGWDYVGEIGGASGVYLGNGWVLTAAHVGFGNFVLGGITYTAISGSGQYVTPLSNGTTEDLYIFRIAAPPNLPLLTLSLNPPVAFSQIQAGSSVAMLGFGGSGPNLSWGLDTVTEINQTADLTPNHPYISNDFFTDNGTVNRGSSSVTNNWTLVIGDSGGANFTYNAATQKWELAGINEITGSYSNYSGSFNGDGTFSGMVQLNTYASQINAIVSPPADTPTMPLPGLIVLAALLFLAASRSLGMKSRAQLISCPCKWDSPGDDKQHC